MLLGVEMKVSKTTLNLSVSLIYKLITCVVGILIPRMFVITYGSELNGLQSSVTQIFAYVALIEAGIGEAALQSLFGPIARKDYHSANRILAATTHYYNRIGFIYFIILLAVSLCYPLIVEVSGLSYLMVVGYIILSGATTGVNFFYQSKIILLMQAEGSVYYNSMFAMISYLLISAIKITLICYGMNILFIQAGFFIVNLLVIYLYYRVAIKKYSWVNFKAEPDFNAISKSNYVLIHKISGIAFNNTDIILLTIIANLEVVSIYAMYKLIINMITTIIASFGDSINYKLGQVFNNNSLPEYCQIIDKFNSTYSIIAFSIFTITSIMLIPFLKLYTSGMDINYIYYLMPLLYVTIEILQVGREAMLRTVTVAGHFKETIHQSICEMVINIIVSVTLMLILKSYWGPIACLYGALLGTVASLVYRTLALNSYANKRILKRTSWQTNKIMLVNVILYALIYYMSTLYNWDTINTYAKWIVASIFVGLIVFTIVILGHLLFNKTSVQDLYGIVKSKIAFLR